MLSDAEMLARMKNGWRMGKPETICGNGSTMENTAQVRKWLPTLVERYGIHSVCDAGAGDLVWIRRVHWPVIYQAFDLIPRRPEVHQLDITREALPSCDAILCRMVLNHLCDDPERICRTLALFRQSAKFLIATQFEGLNLPQRSVAFYRLDLRAPEYELGEPLEKVADGGEANGYLALWRLQPC